MADAKITITAQDAVSEVLSRINDAMKATGGVTVEVSDAMKTGAGSADTFSEAIAKLGSSFAARVAEGVLLRDAVHSLIDVVKDGIMALPDLVEHTMKTGDALYEMSLKTGASVENLSALRYVASQTGIDFDAFGNTLFKMEMALGSTGQKAIDLQDKLDNLGLDLQTLKNEKPDQAFIDIMSALEEMPNRADQATIGMALFGKGFKDMAGLTQESITGLMQEARDLGLVMTTETAAAAHAAEIGFKGFSMQLEAVGMEIAATTLPALTALTHLISGEFHSAVESVGHPVVDLKQFVEDVILTLLDWSSVGLSVAQFLDDAFQGTRAMFFDVTAKVVDLGNAFVHLLEMGADLAAKTPLVGKEFLGVRDALKDTNEWLGGFAKGLHDESDGAIDAAGKHRVYFDGLQGGISDMKANFHDAFVKSGQEIDDFAAKSHNAFGGVGTDVAVGSDEAKKYAAAWVELTSIGNSYADTVAQINPKLVAEISYYIEAGAKVGTLAAAYSDVLTPAQVDAIDQMVKANDKYSDSWDKTQAAISAVWDAAFAAEQERTDTGLQLKLDKIAKQQAAEEDQARKKITDEELLEQMLNAIDYKYDQLRANTKETDERNVEYQLRGLWTNYYDGVAQKSGTVVDQQIAAVDKWYDDQVDKAIKAGIVNQKYYDDLYDIAQKKTQDVINLNDPRYKANKDNLDTMLKDTNTFLQDVYGGFSKTFSTDIVKLLDGSGSLHAVWSDVWQQMKKDVENILSDLLNNVIQGFITGAETKLGGFLASLVFGPGAGGGSTTGGSGGEASWLAGLIPGGGGSPHAGDPGNYGGGYGSGPGVGPSPNPGSGDPNLVHVPNDGGYGPPPTTGAPFGVSPGWLPPGSAPGNNDQGFSVGGIVYAAMGFGPRGTDTVPAWLTPGERVLTVQDTQSFDRLGGIAALRSGGFGGAALQANIDGLAAQVRRQADAHASLVESLPLMLKHAMRGA